MSMIYSIPLSHCYSVPQWTSSSDLGGVSGISGSLSTKQQNVTVKAVPIPVNT